MAPPSQDARLRGSESSFAQDGSNCLLTVMGFFIIYLGVPSILQWASLTSRLYCQVSFVPHGCGVPFYSLLVRRSGPRTVNMARLRCLVSLEVTPLPVAQEISPTVISQRSKESLNRSREKQRLSLKVFFPYSI